MVGIDKNEFGDLKTKISQKWVSLPDIVPFHGTLCFLSFDLVNSTEFKVRKPNVWQNTVKKFYQFVSTAAQRDIKNCFLWKKAGDEVLLFFQPDDVKELSNSLIAINHIQSELRETLRTDTDSSGILDLKATVW